MKEYVMPPSHGDVGGTRKASPRQRSRNRPPRNQLKSTFTTRTTPTPSDPDIDASISSDRFSLEATMSIIRLFIKNNPEGCPIFEISSTKKDVVGILFPALPVSMEALHSGGREAVKLGSTRKGEITAAMTGTMIPKAGEAVLTRPSPGAISRAKSLVDLDVTDVDETTLPIEVILPSTSPAPPSSTLNIASRSISSPLTDSARNSPWRYTSRLIPPTSSINLSTKLNTHALATSYTEEKYMISPTNKRGMEVTMARLGYKKWEERERSRRRDAMEGIIGRGEVFRRGGDQDRFQARTPERGPYQRRIVSADEGYGVSNPMNQYQQYPHPSFYLPTQAISYPLTPPYQPYSPPPPPLYPSLRSVSYRPTTNHPTTPPARKPNHNPPFTWPPGTSAHDRTVFIKPHEILDHILSFGYTLLGSHVEAYGWEGGICDVHTFAGPKVAELRERAGKIEEGLRRVLDNGEAAQEGKPGRLWL